MTWEAERQYLHNRDDYNWLHFQFVCKMQCLKPIGGICSCNSSGLIYEKITPWILRFQNIGIGLCITKSVFHESNVDFKFKKKNGECINLKNDWIMVEAIYWKI